MSRRRKAESSRSDEKSAPQTPPTVDSAPQAVASTDGAPVKASPLAKKLRVTKKWTCPKFKALAPGGRIVRKDIEAALSSGQSSANSVQSAEPTLAPGASAGVTNY
ncbi:hypothetical protein [Candidatus Villigracilis saccharophilus]|uniref:hypothetical protein n=1 Tax=Candidatus Villigracilis saccharophilus TaxID=3140684 RepID=UPI0031F0A9AB